MGLINKILLESEDDNLFQPRRLEDRLSKLSPLERRMITEFTAGKLVYVYVIPLKKFIKARIWYDARVENRAWRIGCNLYIKVNDVSPGQLYGTYRGICKWNIKKERWEFTENKKYNNLKNYFYWDEYKVKPTNLKENENDLFQPRRIETREEEWNKQFEDLLIKYNIKEKAKDIFVGKVLVTENSGINSRITKYLFRNITRFRLYLESKGKTEYQTNYKLISYIELLKDKESLIIFLEDIETEFYNDLASQFLRNELSYLFLTTEAVE